MFSTKIILAIETSCDETSVAVVKGRKILSNYIFSQASIHAEFGGVVPNIARLEHEKKIDSAVEQALESANVKLEDIEAVAVTIGPGLAIALGVGINKAKDLSLQNQIPLIPINHMEGHLLSGFADNDIQPNFPAIGLLLSGGHTEFLEVKEFGEYNKIGETQDDAIGEAFDKAAAMLGLQYPGGPKLSKLANGSSLSWEVVKTSRNDQISFSNRINLPLTMSRSKDLNMSFSGLKTAFMNLISNEHNSGYRISDISSSFNIDEGKKIDLAFMFETTVVEIIRMKLESCLKTYSPKQLWIGGGVISNTRIHKMIEETAKDKEVEVITPHNRDLKTDNAGMIGLVASQILSRGEYVQPELESIDRLPRLGIEDRLVSISKV